MGFQKMIRYKSSNNSPKRKVTSKSRVIPLSLLKKAYMKREKGYTDGMQSSNRKYSNF
jgi:hypothetical protein